MITPDYASNLARYNTWMNERMYEICSSIPDAERKRDVGAFFKSIHGTLNHLLVADNIWMSRFTSRALPFKFSSLAQELHADFGELRAARKSMDGDIEAWAAGLTQGVLDRELAYTSVVNPAPRRIAMALAVAHFFNHQTHHRGQLTTLIMQRGIDPGVTDLMWAPQH